MGSHTFTLHAPGSRARGPNDPRGGDDAAAKAGQRADRRVAGRAAGASRAYKESEASRRTFADLHAAVSDTAAFTAPTLRATTSRSRPRRAVRHGCERGAPNGKRDDDGSRERDAGGACV